MKLSLVLFAAGLATVTTATPALASAPSAWAALDKQSSAACIKAAGLRNAKAGPSVHFSDTMLIDARSVTGTYPQAHMKGAKGSMLCLFNRKTKRVEVQDANKMWPPTPVVALPAKDVRWVGEYVAGTSTVHDSLVTLMFGSDGKLTGKSSCNNYSVNYMLTDSTLKVYPPMIGTRMMCPPEIMAQEALFQDILGKGSSVGMTGEGRLVITASDGRTLSFARE